MEFEWDPAKEAANLTKHGISFVAAAQVLETGTALEFQSDRGGEPRWVAIGMHPMSARRARHDEEQEYRTHVSREKPEEEQG